MMKTVLPDMTIRILHPAQRALVAVCRLAGLLAALALPACSENIRQREQDISDARERYRQILEEQQIVQAIDARAGRIEVSKEKAWLYQPYSASYSDGLRQTLPRIVPYPITYAIKNDYNPRSIPPPRQPRSRTTWTPSACKPTSATSSMKAPCS